VVGDDPNRYQIYKISLCNCVFHIKIGEKREFVPLSPSPESLTRDGFSKEKIKLSVKEVHEKTKEEEELEIPAFLRKKIKY